MIPILYSSTETTFTSNGIGRLAECTSCIVTEERNGQYELEMIYPVSGKYYSQITQGSIISVTHDDSGDRQPFRVYRKSAPMDGLVTFNAHHISYDLNHIILHPMTAISVTDAFDQFSIDTTPANPFTFWTDMTTNADFSVDVPASIRSKLGGSEGSILDVYGGEFKWDNRTVRLYSHRGQATDITIRYGKNLTDIKQEVGTLDNYTGLVPYWYDEETETLVTLPAWYVLATDQTEVNLVAMDFSDQWEEAPTAGELRQKAIGYLDSNKPYVPDENIKISFVQLWQTEEYKDVAILQRVNLCDRVNVYYSALGITVEDVEVIKVVYNVLLDRYDEMELGEAQSSLASTLVKPLEQAIKSATTNFATKNRVRVELLALQDELQTQIDSKIQTWYQATDPASAWTTADLKEQHDGDLWCYTGATTSTYTQYGTYRYKYNSATQTGTWESYSATDELFDAIDGKTAIFYGSPTGTYTGVQTNDYLVDPSTSKTYRWSGSAWVVVTDYTQEIDTAVQNATSLITGGMGGNIVFVYDANGKPVELLVMDTEDTATAVHVLRINVNGIGFSSTGINGPYTSAWTLDGQFVADFITAGSLSANLIRSGTLSANLIKGGTLKLGAAANENGTLEVYDANNDLIGTWTNTGLVLSQTRNKNQTAERTLDTYIGDSYAMNNDNTSGEYYFSPNVLGNTPAMLRDQNGDILAFHTITPEKAGRISDGSGTAPGIRETYYYNGGAYKKFFSNEAISNNKVYKGQEEWRRDDKFVMRHTEYGNSGQGPFWYLNISNNLIYFDNAFHNMFDGAYLYGAIHFMLSTGGIRLGGGSGSTAYTLVINSSGNKINGSTIQLTTSSKRYKHDITDQISAELDPHRLYDLKMKQFVYNDDHEPPYANMKGKTIPGFIAEDVAEIYPAAVIESGGQVESWSEAQIVPAMLALIQEQKKTIDSLEERVAKLEQALAKLV